MQYGIDLSHWNLVDDWHAVAGHGISFASIKVTEGADWADDQSRDPQTAPDHIAGARSVNITPGGYHFARPGSVTAQMRHFAQRLTRYDLTMPGCLRPMLDIEDANIPQPDRWIDAALRELYELTGTRALVYAPRSWFHNRLDAQWRSDSGALLWVADWDGDPGHPGFRAPEVALHQHTNEGRVRGIPHLVDRNATVGDWTLEDITIEQGSGGDPPSGGGGDSDTGGRYTIQPGDTLSALAHRWGTTVRAIVRINGIANPDRIYAGDTLIIPGEARPDGNGTYRVQPGDTLSEIAQRFGWDWRALARHNNIANPDRIYPGQIIHY